MYPPGKGLADQKSWEMIPLDFFVSLSIAVIDSKVL
jgi:hypothetical protein